MASNGGIHFSEVAPDSGHAPGGRVKTHRKRSVTVLGILYTHQTYTEDGKCSLPDPRRPLPVPGPVPDRFVSSALTNSDIMPSKSMIFPLPGLGARFGRPILNDESWCPSSSVIISLAPNLAIPWSNWWPAVCFVVMERPPVALSEYVRES